MMIIQFSMINSLTHNQWNKTVNRACDAFDSQVLSSCRKRPATTHKMYMQQPTFSSCNFLEKVLAKNSQWTFDPNLLYRKEELGTDQLRKGSAGQRHRIQYFRDRQAEQSEPVLLLQSPSFWTAEAGWWKWKYRTTTVGTAAPMVKGAASQVLQVPPLKSGVYLGYSVCFDVYANTDREDEIKLSWVKKQQTLVFTRVEGCLAFWVARWPGFWQLLRQHDQVASFCLILSW